ncbi:MAG: SH3 domain-containing protein [Oscillatoriales cyanobacterium]|nr:MAG: SH3 domain-containing protein [Oscillatoriales cyanobacterium]
MFHKLLSLGFIFFTTTGLVVHVPQSHAAEPPSDTILPAENTYLAEANAVVYCLVVNIQRGQLAVRSAPGGRSVAGLNNDNAVRFIRQQDKWYYVEVVNGPNSRVNGIRGWVNSDYLECAWD